jgi:hypothetical protein
MPHRPARLLCVGKDLELLQARCAALSQSGYDAKSAPVDEAEVLLRAEKFDLVIASAWLSEWDKSRIRLGAGATPTYVLTLARDLLAQVEELLPQIIPD